MSLTIRRPSTKRRSNYTPMYKSLKPTYPGRIKGISGTNYMYNKRQMRQEVKYNDINYVGPLAPIGIMTSVLLDGVQQGTDYNQRIGRQINILSFELRYIFYNYQTLTNAGYPTLIRMMLVRDRQSNGAVYTPGTLLQNITTPTTQCLSATNINTKDRFHIYWDKLIELNPMGAPVAITPSGTFPAAIRADKYYRKFTRPIKVTYGGTAGTIGSINTNGLFLVILANDDPDCEIYGRIRFTDA